MDLVASSELLLALAMLQATATTSATEDSEIEEHLSAARTFASAAGRNDLLLRIDEITARMGESPSPLSPDAQEEPPL